MKNKVFRKFQDTCDKSSEHTDLPLWLRTTRLIWGLGFPYNLMTHDRNKNSYSRSFKINEKLEK